MANIQADLYIKEINMLQLLIKIIPLDLAATLSPGILAISVYLLTSQKYKNLRIWSFFLGSLLAGIGATVLGIFLGSLSHGNFTQTKISAIFDCFLGIVFLLLGFKILLSRDTTIIPKEQEKSQIIKWLIIGFLASATNFDALFLNFAAAKEVSKSNIDDLAKTILFIINLIFFTLPITLPLFLYSVFPKYAQKILNKINYFLTKYGRQIVFALFLIFALMFFWEGLKFFIK